MDIQRLLCERFGLAEFRPGQQEVIAALERAGRALAVFPTGGGKSLCYQLPALEFEGVTLVVSPLLALMKDQIDFLQARGIEAARLDSTLNAQEAQDVNARLLSGTLKLLYVAPERFNNERFLSTLSRARIALLAIDEAHCISEWGHNFRPDYLKLTQAARAMNAERVLALTATATPQVVADICAAFAIPADCAIVTGFYRPNLHLALTPVAADARDSLLLKRLRERKPGPTIVYVTLQKTAERIASFLAEAGFPAQAYHAGMPTDARTQAQETWMASPSSIVVATIAFGMGIDKSDVRGVYHYNLPKSLESYSQEIGRAGRDGLPAVVEMLACPDDVPTLENFAYGDTPTREALRTLLQDLLARGTEFDIALQPLADRHDLRLLVLRTALTYLELDGVFQQGTPFYAGYEMRPHIPAAEIVSKFPGRHSTLIADIFARAKHGRLWYSLNPSEMAQELGEEPRRLIRALEVLEERGFVELRAADIRQRYTRLREMEDADALVESLCACFLHREGQEIARLRQVLDLVTRDGCQVNALVGYFGEERAAPCGHCTWCRTHRQAVFPTPAPLAPLAEMVDAADFAALCAAHPEALGQARQAARFLCGLSSPALSRAKLTRHALFGTAAAYHFAEVLDWCVSFAVNASGDAGLA